MRRGLLIAGLAAGLAGCDWIDSWTTDPAIRACSIAVQSVLRSPSSFTRIDASITDQRVFLTFDATNPLGVVLRDNAVCSFWQDIESISEPLKKIGYVPDLTLRAIWINSERMEPITFNHAVIALFAAGLLTIDPEKTKLGADKPLRQIDGSSP